MKKAIIGNKRSKTTWVPRTVIITHTRDSAFCRLKAMGSALIVCIQKTRIIILSAPDAAQPWQMICWITKMPKSCKLRKCRLVRAKSARLSTVGRPSYLSLPLWSTMHLAALFKLALSIKSFRKTLSRSEKENPPSLHLLRASWPSLLPCYSLVIWSTT